MALAVLACRRFYLHLTQLLPLWLLRPLYWPHCIVRKQATPSVVFHILVIVCIEEADMLGQLGEVVKILRFAVANQVEEMMRFLNQKIRK